MIYSFLEERVDNPDSLKLLGAKSTAALHSKKGAYDYSDAGYMSETKSYTMGRSFVPEPIGIASKKAGLLKGRKCVYDSGGEEYERYVV